MVSNVLLREIQVLDDNSFAMDTNVLLATIEVDVLYAPSADLELFF